MRKENKEKRKIEDEGEEEGREERGKSEDKLYR